MTSSTGFKELLARMDTLIASVNDGVGRTNVALEGLRGDVRVLNEQLKNKADLTAVDKRISEAIDDGKSTPGMRQRNVVWTIFATAMTVGAYIAGKLGI